MGLLFKFLFRNMKGLRGLVVLAVILTVFQVSSDSSLIGPSTSR